MLEQILAQQSGFYDSTSSSSSSSSSTTAMDKDDFLKLLVTQLQHQDPLNPEDDKDFIAQLAQFSSLEQMNNVASGLDTLNETVSGQDALSAANYLGKTVVASGSTITKLDSGISPIYFTLSDAASKVHVNIYDQNKNLIKTETLSSMQEGEYTYNWNGLNYSGNKASNGQYSVYFSAEGTTGAAVTVSSEVSGQIVGINKTSSGVVFTLSDGRTVKFSDVSMITQTNTSSGTSNSAGTSSSDS